MTEMTRLEIIASTLASLVYWQKELQAAIEQSDIGSNSLSDLILELATAADAELAQIKQARQEEPNQWPSDWREP